jgi:hypothetical protein
VEGHDIVDGDHSDQRLAPRCRHGFWLAGVHDDRWSKVLPLRRWQVGVRLGLGLEPKDYVDVEQLVLMPT